jgi:peptide chain release factor 2
MIIKNSEDLLDVLRDKNIPKNKKIEILDSTDVSLLQEVAAKELFNLEGESTFCVFDITVGNGGQDAQQWCEMLRDMYLGYFNKSSIKFKILEQDPTADGLRSVLIKVRDNYQKYLSEIGIHRLIRKSPFSREKRQTSFVMIKISPVKTLESIVINKSDIRIDTFRASGAGGQHVNKSDSAVRIVHIPTGTVVSCQSERSQHQNKESAMNLLKYRLRERQLREQQELKRASRANSAAVTFGKHFRTYVFHPQFFIKDIRLNIKASNTKILKGNLDTFLNNNVKKLLTNLFI